MPDGRTVVRTEAVSPPSRDPEREALRTLVDGGFSHARAVLRPLFPGRPVTPVQSEAIRLLCGQYGYRTVDGGRDAG